MRLLLSRPVTTYLLSASGVLLAASLLVASAADEKAKKSAAKSTAIKPEAVKLGRPVDFLKDVYPAIEQNCIACHNVAINESKLVLEEVKDLLKGGKRGTSIVAKQPDKSLLYLVASRQKKPHMPPLPNNQDAKAFTPRELGLLRQWILEGATGGTGGRKQMLQFAPLPDSARAIYSVAISPWNRFAAAGRANQVEIYDTILGEKVATLIDPNLAAIKFEDKAMYPGGAAHRDFVHSMSFSPGGGTVTMTVSRAADTIEVSVEDEGPGIPDGSLDSIFERFYSERPEGEQFGTHSGLGLSIARQVVEAHGGSIMAENRRRADGAILGARFRVRLPAG